MTHINSVDDRSERMMDLLLSERNPEQLKNMVNNYNAVIETHSGKELVNDQTVKLLAMLQDSFSSGKAMQLPLKSPIVS